MNDPRLARLEHLIREQDERFDRNDARRQREVAALKAATADDTPELTDVEQNRITLLDPPLDPAPAGPLALAAGLHRGAYQDPGVARRRLSLSSQ